MPAKTINATVTAKAGPANTLTAGVFTGLTSVKFDSNGMLEIVDGNGKVSNLDINAATTFTVTISGSTYTVVVS